MAYKWRLLSNLLIGMILQAPEALVFIVGSHADLVLEHPETEVDPRGTVVSESPVPLWFGARKFMAPRGKKEPPETGVNNFFGFRKGNNGGK